MAAQFHAFKQEHECDILTQTLSSNGRLLLFSLIRLSFLIISKYYLLPESFIEEGEGYRYPTLKK